MALDAKAPTAREIRIAVALTALLLFLPVIGIATRPQLQKADFQVLYTGGLIVREGHASKLYDLAEQQRVQEGFMHRKGLLPDPYPPFHALLFAPLTLLGYRAAYLTWGAINVLLWVAFQTVIRRELSGNPQPFRYLLLSASFFPLWLALMEGQTSLFLLVSFALTFAYLKRERHYSAGFALGIGLLKFPIIVPFGLVFLLRRKWAFIAGLATATILLTAISIAAVGLRGALAYVTFLVDTMKHASNPAYVAIQPWNMPTIRGLVSRGLRGAVSERFITTVAAVLSVALVSVTAWYWGAEDRRGSRDSYDLMFAAALAVALLSSPYLYPHDLTLMLVAIILVVSSGSWPTRSPERLVLRVAILILYASPLYLSGLLINLIARQQLYVLTPVLVAFAIAAVALARRNRRQLLAEGKSERAAAVATNRVSVTT